MLNERRGAEATEGSEASAQATLHSAHCTPLHTGHTLISPFSRTRQCHAVTSAYGPYGAYAEEDSLSLRKEDGADGGTTYYDEVTSARLACLADI